MERQSRKLINGKAKLGASNPGKGNKMNKPRIYTQALRAINNNNLSAKLFSGATKHVFLNRTNGSIKLVYQRRDASNLVQKCEQVECGTYMPGRGWIFSLDRDTYTKWVERTGHAVAKSVPVIPRLMCVELRQEWRAAGGI